MNSGCFGVIMDWKEQSLDDRHQPEQGPREPAVLPAEDPSLPERHSFYVEKHLNTLRERISRAVPMDGRVVLSTFTDKPRGDPQTASGLGSH